MAKDRDSYEIRRQQKLYEQQRVARQRLVKRVGAIILTVAVLSAGVVATARYIKNQPQIPEGDVISRKGFHWHPELSIIIKGEKQDIAANIGIGVTHAELHTHDATGVVHMEMKGLVTKDETTLGAFFRSWGKEFNANCIFDRCNGPDGAVQMTVNGEANTEFENYPMKDKDRIEIRYE